MVIFGCFYSFLVTFDHLRHSVCLFVGPSVGNTLLYCIVFCHFGSSGVILSHFFLLFLINFGCFLLFLVTFDHLRHFVHLSHLCRFWAFKVVLSHFFVVFGHFWLLLVIFGHFLIVNVTLFI